MNIRYVSISELIPYKNNPRDNDAAVDAVAASIKEFGFKVPIVIDKHNIIVCGHTRLKAAAKLGIESVPCIIADDLTPEQIRAFRLADNKTAELAVWNDELLMKELEALQAFNMDEFGFNDLPDFKIASTDAEAEETAEYLDSIEEPIVKQGDIWKLGDHILICGDCTDSEVIKTLMGDDKADLLLTDPPYNVDVSNSRGMTIQNDNMADTDFYNFLCAAFASADAAMKAGAAFYIWHADSEGYNFRKACRHCGWDIRECLIWVKDRFVLGRQDYHWQHEPCLYGWKSGSKHYFFKNRKQSTVIDCYADIDMMNEQELRDYIKNMVEYSTVIREKNPRVNDDHPTMKPITLMSRLIKNSTRKDAIVLDIFGGSGSTLISCENLQRICRICELDEKYCDATIHRWELLTGRTAEKIN